jgi:hypothetical protein
MEALMRYWINTVSRDHVQLGMAGGFTQANHGRATTLRRLAHGDLMVFYSPRTTYPEGEALQQFTAIGRVVDDEPYEAEMTPTFHPWRRRMEFWESQAVPIRDLIDYLSLIKEKRHWGYVFRRGLFEIEEADFRRIADAMGVSINPASNQA